ncbi:alpha-N-arabinofuranosidase [Flavihumibacter petaseus]|uniref:non-reducing end alpha-L-arabinofuranosidase n=1 Tax=Flavihumibacter petaseus NBRC 106054 TaxID=1220578 RepID=A0A0E9MYG8_9BACT|nr:alpha-L-arabinofuranosidase C-terminal domain-containing protein [Flavihumibacter petaseus]GAO42451.1 alpha-L-arabinofuranosidase [Flavihumibacter petaseus NBRC 106054]
MLPFKKPIRTAVAFLAAVMAGKGVAAQDATGTLHFKDAQITINKNIYGHFAEHLGTCIYGGFFVGDTSRIPNTEGLRNDVVEALKKLKVPQLRWPGGCFADTYHWKDGVGDRKKRPTIVNTWWGGVTEDNSFGTHDFLNLCERIGASPYLAGNVGSGSVQELSDWVQYVNFDGTSPMSKWREENGRKQAWDVQYWGVGNEAWGCGGNMTAEYYANEYRKYATFMNNYSKKSRLFRIASGANSGDLHWTEVLMRDIPNHMLEGVALHHYSVIDWDKKGSATGFTEVQYAATMRQAWKMEELVTKHSAIMDKYDPKKRVALVVDEWGGWYDVEPGTNPGFLFQQNTIRDAVLAGLTLNIFNNHADRVRMANLAQAINVLQAVILTNGAKMVLTPTYHVMEMYNVHQDATLIPITLKSPDYILGKDTVPAVSVSASKNAAGKVAVSLTNVDPKKTQLISIKLEGMSLKQVSGRILTSANLQDYNGFDTPDKIRPVVFNGAQLKGDQLEVKLPPASVVVLSLQ